VEPSLVIRPTLSRIVTYVLHCPTDPLLHQLILDYHIASHPCHHRRPRRVPGRMGCRPPPHRPPRDSGDLLRQVLCISLVVLDIIQRPPAKRRAHRRVSVREHDGTHEQRALGVELRLCVQQQRKVYSYCVS
jgi:hypothetical protein